jgi:hypothetical protein
MSQASTSPNARLGAALHTVGSPPAAARAPTLEDQKRFVPAPGQPRAAHPLNSILGFSEILADELYGPLGAPQYKEYAQIIQGSGHKLLKLVNQVLEIAPAGEPLQPLDLRAEPLEAALDDVDRGR